MAGAFVGAVTVALLNSIASLIPESLYVVAQGILGPASSMMIDYVMPIIFILAAIDAGRKTGAWGIILGGMSLLIMKNATPGAILGIIIGQSMEDSGFNKSVKIMIAVVAILFIVIGIARGFWQDLYAIIM